MIHFTPAGGSLVGSYCVSSDSFIYFCFHYLFIFDTVYILKCQLSIDVSHSSHFPVAVGSYSVFEREKKNLKLRN
uniref:Uncharacterized protein n=1 Tax=Arundo donax TaxID=35708 RepID=A0A0A9ALS1_ARUDO